MRMAGLLPSGEQHALSGTSISRTEMTAENLVGFDPGTPREPRTIHRQGTQSATPGLASSLHHHGASFLRSTRNAGDRRISTVHVSDARTLNADT